MSAASGVRVPDALVRELRGSIGVRALKIEVRGGQLESSARVAAGGAGGASWEAALDRLRPLAEAGRPCYFVVFKAGGGALVVSWVPDDAMVKDKMLYSSSKQELRRAVADARGKPEDYYVTDAADLSRAAYEKHRAVKGPLTFVEEQRRDAPVRFERGAAQRSAGFGLLAQISGKPAAPPAHLVRGANGGGDDDDAGKPHRMPPQAAKFARPKAPARRGGARPSRAFTAPPGEEAKRAAAAATAAAEAEEEAEAAKAATGPAAVAAPSAPRPRHTRDDSAMTAGPGVASLLAKFQH